MGEARIRKKSSEQSAPKAEQSLPTIEVICVTYHQEGPLKVLVQSFLNQTASNWKLKVIHDGFDADFLEMMSRYVSVGETRIEYGCTDRRFNDYGHSLRAEGLKDVVGGRVTRFVRPPRVRGNARVGDRSSRRGQSTKG